MVRGAIRVAGVLLAAATADLAAAAGAAETIPSQVGCLRLKSDCGLDTASDDAAAFEQCQEELVHLGGGCVVVPAGQYRLSGVMLNASNTAWFFEDGVAMEPWPGLQKSVALISIGASEPTATSSPSNITIMGPPGAQHTGGWTMDVSRPLFCPWHTHGVQVGSVTGFRIANLLIKQADNETIPNLLCGQDSPAMGTGKGKDGRSPMYGEVTNITAVGGTPGYGLIQLQSAQHVHFSNLEGVGGYTLRLETGGNSGGDPSVMVNNITADNITCHNGRGAFAAWPHSQKNGDFHLRGLYSYGCAETFTLAPGYSDSKRPGHSWAKTPGWFSNSSTIDGKQGANGQFLRQLQGQRSNGASATPILLLTAVHECVVGVYAHYSSRGSAYKCFHDSSRGYEQSKWIYNLSSCQACSIGGGQSKNPQNWNATVTGVHTVGFPGTADRSICRADGLPKLPLCGCPYEVQSPAVPKVAAAPRRTDAIHWTVSSSSAWSRIKTWCFPTFAKLPLTSTQLDHYSRFDMVDLCGPGMWKDPATGVYATNVTDTSSAMAAEILARKPDAFVSPYIGFEIGQVWYAAQQEFNTNPQYSHMWLRYSNGSLVVCDPSNPSRITHGICALLQLDGSNVSRVYDWRAPGMTEYFVQNITGPFYSDAKLGGVFFDDIYTICELMSSAPADFNASDASSFCDAAFDALRAVVVGAKAQKKLPILSIKGDETNSSAFSMEKYTDVVAPDGTGGDAMAYFEYWGIWPGQPRNEAMLSYAIRWGAMGVPMQMHATLGPSANATYPPNACGAPGATLAENHSMTGNFSLAMFLLAANERSYYSTGSGWNPSLDQALWLSEYDRSLGAPASLAKQVAPHVYERDFENVHVYVNMSDCTMTQLQWKS